MGKATEGVDRVECAGMIVEMTADATLQGATAVLKQEESLIGEALEDVPELTGRKDGSGKCYSPARVLRKRCFGVKTA